MRIRGRELRQRRRDRALIPLHTMTREEVVDLARGMVAREVICSSMVPQNMWTHVFLPLAMANLKRYYRSRDFWRIGQVWAFTNDVSCGRSINGWPMFLTVRITSRKDWNRALRLYHSMKEALDAVEKSIR